jgi:hypothetical protein
MYPCSDLVANCCLTQGSSGSPYPEYLYESCGVPYFSMYLFIGECYLC